MIGLLILTSNLSIQAQSNDTQTKYFIPGIRFHYGYIFAHTKSIEAAAYSNPLGLQTDFSWHFTSAKAYDYCNCYPRLGVSLYYWDFRNPEILGKGINILAFAEPFLRPGKRISFSIRPGMGISYLSNPYDEISNPENLCYSTKFAFALLINLSIYYKVSKHLRVNLAGNYNHISNGGIKIPNKGLNYPSVSFGLDYNIGNIQFPERAKIQPSEFQRNNFIKASILLGFKGITEDDKLYLVYGVLAKFGRQFTQMSAFTIGSEFIIDGAEKELANIYSGIPSNAPYKLSLTGGYAYLLGRFSLNFELGIYIYNINRRTDIIYQRYGIDYKIIDNFYFGINLKAHRHVADFFDVRMGYIF